MPAPRQALVDGGARTRANALPNSDAAVPEEQHFLLSRLSPGSLQKRIALGIVLGLLVFLYLITGPLSGIQLGAVSAFIAVYGTAMFVTDSITAFLLFAQFYIVRSPAILVIASGYLFTALVIVMYVFAFPGVLAPDGVIGGLQTSAWLYVIWHTAFPTFVIAYALSKERDPANRPGHAKVRPAILWAIACTAALAASVGCVTTLGEPALPRLMLDPRRFASNWPYLVGTPIASVCIAAIVALWIRRRSVLDLWLMVVMFLYLIEVPLSWYPQPARFSTGWYAVRVVGFMSSSLVLIVLLYEITTLYAKLLGAVLGQRREREARLMTGNAVAASIAHEIRQPLTAMVTTAEAGFRFLDRPAPNMQRAKEALQQIAADGLRAGTLVETIRANFKSDVRDRSSFDLNELIQEALALGGGELQKHRILVQAAPNRAVPAVKGNRVQLQQVLLNLILNAIDAMAAKDDQRVLTVASESYESDRVVVSVADTGSGIASPDVDRMFNPLFTTKSDGMGMGLSICRAIVEAHEGRLWFTSNTPRGSVFHFTLQADRSVTAAG